MKSLTKYYLLFSFLTSSLLATWAYSDSLGLSGHYGLIAGQYPFIFQNPATAFLFGNHFVADYDGNKAAGGFFLGEDGVLFGIFSGIPTENSLNSSSVEGGMFHLGKPRYTPFVDTSPGMNIDAAATNSAFQLGNLQSRVWRLDDPTDLALESQNLCLILAFGNKMNGFGLLAEFGQTQDKEKHDGLAQESINLRRQNIGIGLGFQATLSPTMALDGYLRTNLYKIENKYQATGSGSEKISATYETSGSFSINSAIRLGYNFLPLWWFYFFLKGQVSDHSTVAEAQAHSGSVIPFHLKDTYSRTGHSYEVSLSFLRYFSNGDFAFVGMIWESAKFSLYYDGRNFQDNRYAQEPYEAELTYHRIPFLVGFMARILTNWQLQASLKSYLVALPESGYHLKEIIWLRNDTNFPDKELKESSANYQDNLDYAKFQVGLSWYIQQVRLDWLTQIELFRRGPNFISNAKLPFFTRLGISYYFKNLFKEKGES